MAGFAIRLQVNADEFEVFVEVARALPSVLVMALRAVRPVRAPMRILVTSRTALRLELREAELPFPILRPLLEAFLGRRVALFAADLHMLPFDLEIGLAVVELLQIPETIRRVAARTRTARELRLEHVLMLVRMAVLAESAIFAGEHEHASLPRRLADHDILRRPVALVAFLRNLLVIAWQLEPSRIVIESQLLVEARCRVAGRAGLLQGLLAELLLMRRRVAVRAKLRILALVKAEEMRDFRRIGRQLLIRRHVAGEAILVADFLVLAGQLEAGRIMVEERALIEGLRRVAGRAGFLERRFLELLLMRSLMAVHAEVLVGIGELILLLAVHDVAGLAIHALVLAGQGEARLRVEVLVAAHADDIPAGRRMALGASHVLELLMERRRMRRLMTGLATLLRKVAEEVFPQGIRRRLGLHPSFGRVTVEAPVLFVLTVDRETGLRSVIEADALFPGAFVVTGFAAHQRSIVNLRRRFLAVTVVIRVTAGAVSIQAFEAEITPARLRWILLMAFDALSASVSAGQDPAGFFMREVRDRPTFLRVAVQAVSALETRRKVIAVLILVTGQALLGAQRRKLIAEVIRAFGYVTLIAFLLGVRADQGITRLTQVIEGVRPFEGRGVVAAAALLAFEFAFEVVNIVGLVTGDTGLGLARPELDTVLTERLVGPLLGMA